MAVAVAVGVGGLLAGACGGPDEPEVDNVGLKSAYGIRIEALARRAWPDWVATELRAGAPGGALIAAEARLSPNDYGVNASMEWELTFRSDRPTTGTDVVRAIRAACAFGPGRMLTSQQISAHVVSPGDPSGVPTELGADCTDPFERFEPWFDQLGREPLPPEVRGSAVGVTQTTPGDPTELGVVLYVETADGTPRVAERLARLVCAGPEGRRRAVQVRSSDQPAIVTDPSIHTVQLVSRSPCRLPPVVP